MKTLENEKCVIVYNPDYTAKTDCMCGRDKTDDVNMPCFFTTTVRGHKKAFEALENIFDEDTTLEKALFTLRENKIKTHYWCAID